MTPDLGIGSHVPILAAAVMRAAGPVLECGMGWWSTPMLHLMCKGVKRLVSYETDLTWMKTFEHLRSEEHLIRHVEDWKAETAIDSVPWAVAFVDNAPGESRVEIVKRLRAYACFIVVHDTCADLPGSGGNYGWKQLDGLFKYQVIYKEMRPWTTVYSDIEEFAL